MDGRYMESRDRLHEDKSWLQALLRGTTRTALDGDGPEKLRQWFHTDPTTSHDGTANTMEDP